MNILVKGNIVAKNSIMSWRPIEETYHAIGDAYNVDESKFVMVIYGNLEIDRIAVMSNDVHITATGFVSVLGFPER